MTLFIAGGASENVCGLFISRLQTLLNHEGMFLKQTPFEMLLSGRLVNKPSHKAAVRERAHTHTHTLST